ncbi:MAG: TadE/TadG family type IV pilus assembly protein [Acidimicrobiales bacterium]
MSDRRRRTDRKGGRTGSDAERGAILVELAIVAPLVIVLVLGIFEITVAWSQDQTVVQAARSGARAVTQTGQDERADQVALRSVKATFDDRWTEVQRVVVYEATSADGSPPTACISSGVTVSPGGVNCNVYVSADLADVLDESRFTDGPNCGSGKSSNWCPSVRDRGLNTADWVGVWVEYDQPWLTGLFPIGGYTITERTVMRMEPRSG